MSSVSSILPPYINQYSELLQEDEFSYGYKTITNEWNEDGPDSNDNIYYYFYWTERDKDRLCFTMPWSEIFEPKDDSFYKLKTYSADVLNEFTQIFNNIDGYAYSYSPLLQPFFSRLQVEKMKEKYEEIFQEIDFADNNRRIRIHHIPTLSQLTMLVKDQLTAQLQLLKSFDERLVNVLKVYLYEQDEDLDDIIRKKNMSRISAKISVLYDCFHDTYKFDAEKVWEYLQEIFTDDFNKYTYSAIIGIFDCQFRKVRALKLALASYRYLLILEYLFSTYLSGIDVADPIILELPQKNWDFRETSHRYYLYEFLRKKAPEQLNKEDAYREIVRLYRAKYGIDIRSEDSDISPTPKTFDNAYRSFLSSAKLKSGDLVGNPDKNINFNK